MLHLLASWSGPLIAVVLALRLRPAYLVILGLLAMAGFIVSWTITEHLYGTCESRCPINEHRIAWVNWFLLTVSPSLVLSALGKHILRTSTVFSAKPS
jgi:hypothetical protein